MIILDIKLKLYYYKELSEEAKEVAFNNYSKYSMYDSNDKKPSKEDIEEEINTNDYFFFKNGDMAETLVYTGGAKEGLVEVTFCGEKYEFRLKELLDNKCDENVKENNKCS